MRTQDAGPSYACSTSSACSHSDTQYPIECAGPQDCAQSSVCCHYTSHTVCTMDFDGGAAAAASYCVGNHGSVVCDHSTLPDLCPPGSTCSAPLDSDNVYFACSM
jgi:hypothetical protein